MHREFCVHKCMCKTILCVLSHFSFLDVVFLTVTSEIELDMPNFLFFFSNSMNFFHMHFHIQIHVLVFSFTNSSFCLIFSAFKMAAQFLLIKESTSIIFSYSFKVIASIDVLPGEFSEEFDLKEQYDLFKYLPDDFFELLENFIDLSSFVQLYILFLCKHNFIYCFKRVFFTFVHIFWQQFHKLITCFYTQLKLVIKLLCFFFNNSKVPDKSIKSLSSHKGSSSSQRILPSGTSCPSLLDVLFQFWLYPTYQLDAHQQQLLLKFLSHQSHLLPDHIEHHSQLYLTHL